MEFAQKLQAVLLESGASPPDLFLEINPQDLDEQKVLEKIDLVIGKSVDNGVQCHPYKFLSSHELSLVPFTTLRTMLIVMGIKNCLQRG